MFFCDFILLTRIDLKLLSVDGVGVMLWINIFSCFWASQPNWVNFIFALLMVCSSLNANWPDVKKMKCVFIWHCSTGNFPTVGFVGKINVHCFWSFKQIQDCPSDVRSADPTAKQIIRNKVSLQAAANVARRAVRLPIERMRERWSPLVLRGRLGHPTPPTPHWALRQKDHGKRRRREQEGYL